MKKKTATIKCTVYEEKDCASPRVQAEGDTHGALMIGLTAILRLYLEKEIADDWSLHKLVDYATQPDEESRDRFIEKMKEENRERLKKMIIEMWEEKEKAKNE